MRSVVQLERCERLGAQLCGSSSSPYARHAWLALSAPHNTGPEQRRGKRWAWASKIKLKRQASAKVMQHSLTTIDLENYNHSKWACKTIENLVVRAWLALLRLKIARKVNFRWLFLYICTDIYNCNTLSSCILIIVFVRVVLYSFCTQFSKNCSSFVTLIYLCISLRTHYIKILPQNPYRTTICTIRPDFVSVGLNEC